tara:strand:- start:233 stop:565 length:333 start_codon:yes stop_codon:yes gene_type:complete
MVKEQYDLNSNGKIDADERALMMEDRRLRMADQDAKRDTQRRLTIACAAGMLLYPIVIVIAVLVGLDRAAELIADIASVFCVAASGVVAAYFGFNAMENKNATSTDRPSK